MSALFLRRMGNVRCLFSSLLNTLNKHPNKTKPVNVWDLIFEEPDELLEIISALSVSLKFIVCLL